MTKHLLLLAAKTKKRKRVAQLRNKPRRRKLSAAEQTAPLGTIAEDRLLSATVRETASAYNAALANAKRVGVEVQQQLVEAETIGDEPVIIAQPIKLGRILRRY